MDGHDEDRDNHFQAQHNFWEILLTHGAVPAMTSMAGMDGGGLAGMSTAAPTMLQFIPGNGYEDRDNFRAHHNFLEPSPTLSLAPAMTSKAGMDGGSLAGMSAARPKMQQFIQGNGSGGITAINGRTCGGSHGLVSAGLSLEQGKGGFLKPKKASGSHKRSSVKNEMRKRNATSEATANGDSEIVRTDVEISTPSHAKQRKLVSDVWKGFDRVREDGKVRALCKICKKDFDGSSKKGTTHLKNHLKRCEKRRNRDEDQELISPVEMGDLTAPSVIKGNVVFDQERCYLALARMIIKRQYPLNIVERELFKTFLNSFQPELELPSQENIMADILHIYRKEREELLMYLDKLSCRFGLAVDLLKDDLEKSSYICFNLRFIDNDWELKEKIIAVRKTEYEFYFLAFCKTYGSVVLSWNIQQKLHPFLAVVPQFSNTSKSVGKLLVEAGLDVIDDILQKIHKSIEYVIETPSRKQRFQDAVNQVKFHGGEVSQDVSTRSDRFLMLEGALRLREVFCVLGKTDCDFNFNPSTEEWDKARVIYKYLKGIYDYLSSLARTKCLTADVYFARLLHIYNLFPCESEHNYLRLMADKMKKKFIDYWEVSGRGLLIASIIDPRLKTSRLDSVCRLIYGSPYPSSLRILDDVAKRYYDFYFSDRPYCMACNFTNVASESTEFRRYFEEPTCPSDEEFDILGWWRINTPKFPTLARMARDFLAVPMPNFLSNSALGTEITRINQAFNAPDPEFLEALICGRDWLETPKRSIS